MPWSIERDGSAVRVHISAPMEGEWKPLMEALYDQLDDTPKAVYMASQVTGGAATDADQLKIIWASLVDLGIPILPPR
jgi:hypothetical protein